MSVQCQLSILFPAFFEQAAVQQDKTQPHRMIVVMSSDRGLCGGIHSGICRALRDTVLSEQKPGQETKLVVIGDKAKAILQRFILDVQTSCNY